MRNAGNTTPRHSTSTPISRRAFLHGTAGAAAIAAVSVAASLAGCSDPEPDADFGTHDAIANGPLSGIRDADPLEVSANSVVTTDDCELLEDTEANVEMIRRVSLPYGTMIWSSDDKVAACLLPSESSSPLASIGLLPLQNGDVQTVIETAVGSDEGFEIYDVRANSAGIVWAEADILSGRWRVYSAALRDGSTLSGAPALQDEGNSAWHVPSLAVSGSYAIWKTSPKEESDADGMPGKIMRARFGADGSDADYLIETDMLTPHGIAAAAEGVVLSVTVDSAKGSHGLVALDADSGDVTETLVLPSPIDPTFFAYGDTGFAFAFEDIYDNDGGIANLGTYTGIGDRSEEWFRFDRTPVEAPAWASGWFIVKSSSVVTGIDLSSRRYFAIEPENATQGYGEYLATEGSGDLFVTYSNIDYSPINGDHIRECNVRVWQPKSI